MSNNAQHVQKLPQTAIVARLYVAPSPNIRILVNATSREGEIQESWSRFAVLFLILLVKSLSLASEVAKSP